MADVSGSSPFTSMIVFESAFVVSNEQARHHTVRCYDVDHRMNITFCGEKNKTVALAATSLRIENDEFIASSSGRFHCLKVTFSWLVVKLERMTSGSAWLSRIRLCFPGSTFATT
jgi:hypothetical protein